MSLKFLKFIQNYSIRKMKITYNPDKKCGNVSSDVDYYDKNTSRLRM